VRHDLAVTAPAWPRPYWRDSGAQALVQWFLFGDFEPELRVDAPRYRTRGTPEGVEVARYAHAAIKTWAGYPLGGTMGRLFADESAALFERASGTRECLILRGNLADPRDLDYLRDLIGTITALLDFGGVAIVDPQVLSMWSAAEWRSRFFDDATFSSRGHVAILESEDAQSIGRRWIHTRGLRKFARPDVSIRNVPAQFAAHAGQLADRFADFQVKGGIVEEGREIVVEGLPGNMHAHRAGTLDDPEFNNVHLAIRWPD
jgi:hypothetical protein